MIAAFRRAAGKVAGNAGEVVPVGDLFAEAVPRRIEPDFGRYRHCARMRLEIAQVHAVALQQDACAQSIFEQAVLDPAVEELRAIEIAADLAMGIEDLQRWTESGLSRWSGIARHHRFDAVPDLRHRAALARRLEQPVIAVAGHPPDQTAGRIRSACFDQRVDKSDATPGTTTASASPVLCAPEAVRAIAPFRTRQAGRHGSRFPAARRR